MYIFFIREMPWIAIGFDMEINHLVIKERYVCPFDWENAMVLLLIFVWIDQFGDERDVWIPTDLLCLEICALFLIRKSIGKSYPNI